MPKSGVKDAMNSDEGKGETENEETSPEKGSSSKGSKKFFKGLKKSGSKKSRSVSQSDNEEAPSSGTGLSDIGSSAGGLKDNVGKKIANNPAKEIGQKTFSRENIPLDKEAVKSKVPFKRGASTEELENDEEEQTQDTSLKADRKIPFSQEDIPLKQETLNKGLAKSKSSVKRGISVTSRGGLDDDKQTEDGVRDETKSDEQKDDEKEDAPPEKGPPSKGSKKFFKGFRKSGSKKARSTSQSDTEDAPSSKTGMSEIGSSAVGLKDDMGKKIKNNRAREMGEKTFSRDNIPMDKEAVKSKVPFKRSSSAPPPDKTGDDEAEHDSDSPDIDDGSNTFSRDNILAKPAAVKKALPTGKVPFTRGSSAASTGDIESDEERQNQESVSKNGQRYPFNRESIPLNQETLSKGISKGKSSAKRGLAVAYSDDPKDDEGVEGGEEDTRHFDEEKGDKKEGISTEKGSSSKGSKKFFKGFRKSGSKKARSTSQSDTDDTPSSKTGLSEIGSSAVGLKDDVGKKITNNRAKEMGEKTFSRDNIPMNKDAVKSKVPFKRSSSAQPRDDDEAEHDPDSPDVDDGSNAFSRDSILAKPAAVSKALPTSKVPFTRGSSAASTGNIENDEEQQNHDSSSKDDGKYQFSRDTIPGQETLNKGLSKGKSSVRRGLSVTYSDEAKDVEAMNGHEGDEESSGEQQTGGKEDTSPEKAPSSKGSKKFFKGFRKSGSKKSRASSQSDTEDTASSKTGLSDIGSSAVGLKDNMGKKIANNPAKDMGEKTFSRENIPVNKESMSKSLPTGKIPFKPGSPDHEDYGDPETQSDSQGPETDEGKKGFGRDSFIPKAESVNKSLSTSKVPLLRGSSDTPSEGDIEHPEKGDAKHLLSRDTIPLSRETVTKSLPTGKVPFRGRSSAAAESPEGHEDTEEQQDPESPPSEEELKTFFSHDTIPLSQEPMSKSLSKGRSALSRGFSNESMDDKLMNGADEEMQGNAEVQDEKEKPAKGSKKFFKGFKKSGKLSKKSRSTSQGDTDDDASSKTGLAGVGASAASSVGLEDGVGKKIANSRAKEMGEKTFSRENIPLKQEVVTKSLPTGKLPFKQGSSDQTQESGEDGMPASPTTDEGEDATSRKNIFPNRGKNILSHEAIPLNREAVGKGLSTSKVPLIRGSTDETGNDENQQHTDSSSKDSKKNLLSRESVPLKQKTVSKTLSSGKSSVQRGFSSTSESLEIKKWSSSKGSSVEDYVEEVTLSREIITRNPYAMDSEIGTTPVDKMADETSDEKSEPKADEKPPESSTVEKGPEETVSVAEEVMASTQQEAAGDNEVPGPENNNNTGDVMEERAADVTTTPEQASAEESGESMHVRNASISERKSEKKDPPNRIGFLVLAVGIVVAIVILVIRERGSRGQCAYDSLYRKVTCKGKQLSSIPTDIPEGAITLHMGSKLDKAENFFTLLHTENFTRLRNLQELRLIKCGIEDIHASAFGDMAELRRLDLRYNRIRVISEDTFRGLRELEYIYLSNNPIESLPEFVFRNLAIENLVLANNPALTHIDKRAFETSKVRSIVMNRCSLSTLDPDVFDPIEDSLEELYITHNMQILDLPPKCFQGLHLQKLTLSHNNLEDVDFLGGLHAKEINLDENPLIEFDCDDCDELKHTERLTLTKCKLSKLSKENFSSMTALRELDLDGNDLEVFNASVFAIMSQLRILDLSNNDIEGLDGNFTGILPELDSLSLDGNNIETLPASLEPLFSELDNLTLHDNPLHCNCELRWFAKWLEQPAHRRILQNIDAVTCETPEQQNFTYVSDYGFQCRVPTILNATFDTDGITLLCTAEGDPPPTVAWVGPVGDLKTAQPSAWDRDLFQTRSSLTISRDGNYTCEARNVVGMDVITINTREMPTSGLKFHVESQEIEILESQNGFMVVSVLLVLLGYMLKYT